MKQLTSRVRYSLLVYRIDGTNHVDETIGEFPFTVAYGSSPAVTFEPLAKLKPGLVGALLGPFGIVAVSAELPVTHPMFRAGAEQIARMVQVQA